MGNCNVGSNCGLGGPATVQIGSYEYNTDEVIGTTKDSILVRGHLINDKRHKIAIKCLSKAFTPEDVKMLEPALRNLKSIENDNLSKFLDYYYDQNSGQLYLITELCPYGNLSDLISEDLKIDPSEDLRTAAKYCQQIIKGLVTLYDKQIYHGRLHPNNIMIQGTKLKLNDFALPDLLYGQRPKKPTVYRAPEMQDRNCRFNEKCDIWSLGVVMYQIVYKANPIKIIGNDYIFYNAEWGRYDPLDNLIKSCLELDPSKRPSIAELRMDLFLKIDVSKINLVGAAWNSGRNKDKDTTPYTVERLFSQIDMSPNFLSA